MPMKPMPTSPTLIIALTPYYLASCVFTGFHACHDFGPVSTVFKPFLSSLEALETRRGSYYPRRGGLRPAALDEMESRPGDYPGAASPAGSHAPAFFLAASTSSRLIS